MNKLIGFAVGAAIAVSPLLALAATISNPLFSNGQTTVDAAGGATVTGTFTLTVGPGEVVEWLRTQSDPSQPFVDTSTGGQLGYQEQTYTNVPFSVKVPPNTGTFYPTVQGAGIFGGNRAINGGDNVVLGAIGLGTVRVVANSSASIDTSDDSLNAKIAAAVSAAVSASLKALGLGGTTAPVVSTACTELAKFSAGLSIGSTGSAVVQLQGWLLSKDPNSIPLIRDGQAKFGYFGSQTSAAVTSYHCN